MMERFIWTKHSQNKMRFYGLSESRVKRVFHNPKRIEAGVAEATVAVMQPASTKRKNGQLIWRQEIWVMFQQTKSKIKVISAWRYPGVSPNKNPIPEEIIREIKEAGLIE